MAEVSALNQQQQVWYEQACAKIDQDRLKQLIFELTARHSPTGAEREVCEYLSAYLDQVGLNGNYQPINELSGNCYGRLKGAGGGPSLMLYAPIHRRQRPGSERLSTSPSAMGCGAHFLLV